MKFEHLGGGSHVHFDGKTYAKGDVVTSPVDLVQMFPGKFRRVDLIGAPETPPPPAVAPQGGGEPASESPSPAKKVKFLKKGAGGSQASEARGDEVTDQFHGIEKGFKVFLRGTQYHVYEGDKTDPINKTGLRQGDVVASIKKYLEE